MAIEHQEDTHEHKQTTGELSSAERRRFMRALLSDLRAVERMLAEGMFEKGVSNIGAEQEMFLVDRSWNASPAALDVLKRLDDPHYTTELGLFNLELNADAQPLSGRGLFRLESQINDLFGRPFDLQELQINLITLSGHVDETDDEFTLSWKQ